MEIKKLIQLYGDTAGWNDDTIPDDDGIIAVVNLALEEAAMIFEKDDSQRWGYTADLPAISAAIRALKI